MLQVYTGDGKGKTSAAVGAAVRAAGAGFQVLFIQFLKDCSSSEISQLNKLGIRTTCFGRKGIIQQANHEDRMLAEDGIKQARAAAKSEEYDVIVLDEVLVAVSMGALQLEILMNFLNECKSEVILTGRNAPEEVIALADYVSIIKKFKHPFDKGKKARKGFEF